MERLLGRKALLDLQPMQPGDVHSTFADVKDLQAAVNYRPDTTLEEGLSKFVSWYSAYHKKQELAPLAASA